MVHIKGFVTEHTIDFILVVTFLDTITNTCFMSSLLCSVLFSPHAIFWYHQNVSGVLQFNKTLGNSCFAYRSQKIWVWIAIIFVTYYFELCELLIMCCSILEKGKATRKGVVYWA